MKYEYTVMLFRFKNAQVHFLHHMNQLLGDLVNVVHWFTWMIFPFVSYTKEEHWKHIWLVFDR